MIFQDRSDTDQMHGRVKHEKASVANEPSPTAERRRTKENGGGQTFPTDHYLGNVFNSDIGAAPVGRRLPK